MTAGADCPYCGERIDFLQVMCPHCGVEVDRLVEEGKTLTDDQKRSIARARRQIGKINLVAALLALAFGVLCVLSIR